MATDVSSQGLYSVDDGGGSGDDDSGRNNRTPRLAEHPVNLLCTLGYRYASWGVEPTQQPTEKREKRNWDCMRREKDEMQKPILVNFKVWVYISICICIQDACKL
ncbi:hypothetical protein PV325_007632 [Microctonus aethiopoides]|nr:hypothetical protein PV325_007632 [Microctonus aethiopoides]